MAYFTLVVNEDGLWAPQFGDHDKDVVVSELDNYRDHGKRRTELRIVKTATARQALIDAKIEEMNAND